MLFRSPAIAGDAEQVTEAWLANRRLSEHTRAAYRRDVAGWLSWCAERDLDPLAASFLDVNAYARGLEQALSAVASRPDVDLHWADAMKLELGSLEPAPTAVVANLPYAVATPVILRTVEDLPSVLSWTVMVQREIADRLRAAPGSRTYGSPSVLVQLACEVRMVRTVDPAVFRPRPRIESAILSLRRTGPAAEDRKSVV